MNMKNAPQSSIPQTSLLTHPMQTFLPPTLSNNSSMMTISSHQELLYDSGEDDKFPNNKMRHIW